LKIVPIIIVALVVALVAAGGGFWYWTTTPQYALEQIKDSAAQHELSKFQKYFDIDQVADSMVKDLMTSELRKTLGGEALERVLSSGLASESEVQHEVASGIEEDIKTLVKTGSFSASGESPSDQASMGALDKRLGIKTLSLKELKGIKVDGNTAMVTMLLHNGKFNADFEFLGELQNKDNCWQATRIVNVVDCFRKLFKLEKQSIKSSS
jgi:hypothetical protein